MRIASFLLVLAALPAERALAFPARAQDPHEVSAGGDAQAEFRRLFGEVERDLRRIDKLLDEARTARLPQGAERAKLLDTTQARGEAVLEGIDKILELARQQQQSSSGGGGGASSNSGRASGSSSGQDGQDGKGEPSPLDRAGEQSTGREATPAAPERGGDQPNGEQRGANGGKKPEPSNAPDGSGGAQGRANPKDPKDGSRPSGTDGKNELADDPAHRATGPGQNTDGARDRWGDLPEHAREVFRMQGGSDLPPRYRDWIDAYYKRLNKKP